jgi:anti-sigma factor RsiW
VSDHLSDLVLSRLIDGDLSLATREAAARHLRECVRCAQRHEALVDVAASLRLEAPASWPVGAADEVMQTIPRRPRSFEAAGAAALSAAVVAVALVELAPLIAGALLVVGLAARLGSLLMPLGVVGGGPGVLAVMLIVAVCAPLAAYPIARWR